MSACVCVLGNQCMCVSVCGEKAENKELMGKTSNAHAYTRTHKVKKKGDDSRTGQFGWYFLWVVFLFLGVFAVLLLCVNE